MCDVIAYPWSRPRARQRLEHEKAERALENVVLWLRHVGGWRRSAELAMHN